MLDDRKMANSIIAEFDKIGIDAKVGGDESQTALLVRAICKYIVLYIQADAKVVTNVVGTSTCSTGGGGVQGKGTGKVL